MFGLPVPGRKLVQSNPWRVRDPAKDIGEPGLRVYIVEPCGIDQRIDRRGPYPATVGAGSQPRPF